MCLYCAEFQSKPLVIPGPDTSINFSFLSDALIRLPTRRNELKYRTGGLDTRGIKYDRKEETGGEWRNGEM